MRLMSFVAVDLRELIGRFERAVLLNRRGPGHIARSRNVSAALGAFLRKIGRSEQLRGNSAGERTSIRSIVVEAPIVAATSSRRARRGSICGFLPCTKWLW